MKSPRQPLSNSNQQTNALSYRDVEVAEFHRAKQSDDKQILRKVEEARKSVERCDAIRRGHLYPEMNPERMKGTISKSAVRYVRKDIQNAASELSLPTRFKTIVRLSNVLQYVTFPYFMILIATSLFRMILPKPWNVIYSPYVVLPMFALAAMFLVLKQYVGRGLNKYVDERSRGQSRDRNLKEIAQQCIYELARQISNSGQDPKKFKFRIFHTDYDGIRIESKPGLVRSYYVASVILGKQKEVAMKKG